LLGVSTKTVFRWEKGVAEPSPVQLGRLQELLHILETCAGAVDKPDAELRALFAELSTPLTPKDVVGVAPAPRAAGALPAVLRALAESDLPPPGGTYYRYYPEGPERPGIAVAFTVRYAPSTLPSGHGLVGELFRQFVRNDPGAADLLRCEFTLEETCTGPLRFVKPDPATPFWERDNADLIAGLKARALPG
jgi:hypothetical protein